MQIHGAANCSLYVPRACRDSANSQRSYRWGSCSRGVYSASGGVHLWKHTVSHLVLSGARSVRLITHPLVLMHMQCCLCTHEYNMQPVWLGALGAVSCLEPTAGTLPNVALFASCMPAATCQYCAHPKGVLHIMFCKYGYSKGRLQGMAHVTALPAS